MIENVVLPPNEVTDWLDEQALSPRHEWRVRLYFADAECMRPCQPGQGRVAIWHMKFDNEMEARMHCAAHGGEYTIIDV